jgi:hypothetical protein
VLYRTAGQSLEPHNPYEKFIASSFLWFLLGTVLNAVFFFAKATAHSQTDLIMRIALIDGPLRALAAGPHFQVHSGGIRMAAVFLCDDAAVSALWRNHSSSVRAHVHGFPSTRFHSRFHQPDDYGGVVTDCSYLGGYGFEADEFAVGAFCSDQHRLCRTRGPSGID